LGPEALAKSFNFLALPEKFTEVLPLGLGQNLKSEVFKKSPKPKALTHALSQKKLRFLEPLPWAEILNF
jgi:hypothetical protein